MTIEARGGLARRVLLARRDNQKMLRKRGVPLGALFGLLLTVALLSGCGGSSADSASVSKAEYVARADEICKHGEAEKNSALRAALKELGRRRETLTRKHEEELVTEFALPPIKRMARELKGIDRPVGEEDKARQLVHAYGKEIKHLEEDPASVTNGSGGAFAEADELARALGMKFCAAI